jgi:hypothetical protein
MIDKWISVFRMETFDSKQDGTEFILKGNCKIQATNKSHMMEVPSKHTEGARLCEHACQTNIFVIQEKHPCCRNICSMLLPNFVLGDKLFVKGYLW